MKGTFYPSDLPAARCCCTPRFPTVEINHTFYRMPKEKPASGWAGQTPEPYRLTLKAPRRITHDSRLKNTGDLVTGFCRVAASLGPKLGALLFQLPPNFKKDLGVFDAFLADLPPKVCAAFEFRHPSWFDDDVFERLSARNLALCVSDSEKLSAPVKVTADYAYFRLRDEGHAGRHRAMGGHDCEGDVGARTCSSIQARGRRERPEFAQLFMRHIGASTEPERQFSALLRERRAPCCEARTLLHKRRALLRRRRGPTPVGFRRRPVRRPRHQYQDGWRARVPAGDEVHNLSSAQ